MSSAIVDQIGSLAAACLHVHIPCILQLSHIETLPYRLRKQLRPIDLKFHMFAGKLSYESNLAR